jgi:hypothetical protein
MLRIKLILFASLTILAVICGCYAEEKMPQGYPIYANISIKNSIAEFNFYTIYWKKKACDEFADIFIERIAVTKPKLNNIEMKIIPKKLGIFYQIKIKNSKQKYTVSFSHFGNRYEGVIDLNPKSDSELRVTFYRKAEGK